MSTDKFNMRQVIIDSPPQLEKGLELAKDIKIQGNFKNVIICGIGGSALPVNILGAAVEPKTPIYAHRDYNLPKKANENSLIICVSYSGNTEETVSALTEAVQKKFKVVGVATGGKIEKICQENKLPFVKIPSGIQPRSATGYLFSALAKILINVGLIENITEEIKNASQEMKNLNATLEKQGKDLAKKIVGKIPVVYSSGAFKAIARIWKIKFNENSKVPAFWNYFPELNHNEMVGFSEIKKDTLFYFIILRDDQTHKRNLKRMELFGSLIKEKGAGVSFVDIKQGYLISEIFSALLLGDWVSYYLALENNVDPTPVKIVEDFKKKLTE